MSTLTAVCQLTYFIKLTYGDDDGDLIKQYISTETEGTRQGGRREKTDSPLVQ